MIRTAIKFGLFVALCTLFLLYLASTIGNTSIGGLVGRGDATVELTAAFRDVSGLLVGDNVKVAGVPVGKVTGIAVEDGEAVVTMAVDADRRLPADTSAGIRWRNLIGQRYVYLFPGDAPTALTDGDRIGETTSVIDLGELFNRLGPIVATIDEGQVNEFLDSMTTALEGNEADISQTLDDLAVVVQGLGDRDQAIGRLIDNLEVVARTVADRDAQIETMLDNLASLSQTFSDNTALLQNALVELASFNRDLSGVLDANRAEIDRLLGNLAATLGTVEDNLGPLETALANLDDNAAATFLSSRHGTFLNQTLLCVTLTVPPCPTPIIPGLDGITGRQATVDAVPYTPRYRSGSDAVLSIVGGQR